LNKKEYSNFNTCEGFDPNGEYFIEYNFEERDINNSGGANSEPNFYIPFSHKHLQSFDVKENEREINDLETRLQQGYHLLIYGLENETLSINDLIDAIYFEVKNYSRITKEDIFIIDELSLVSNFAILILDFLVSNLPSYKDYDRLALLGRFVLIKFKHEKEAIKFYVERSKITLPLVNNRKGSPHIQPTELLKDYLDKN
jgi:hypothetical protein